MESLNFLYLFRHVRYLKRIERSCVDKFEAASKVPHPPAKKPAELENQSPRPLIKTVVVDKNIIAENIRQIEEIEKGKANTRTVASMKVPEGLAKKVIIVRNLNAQNVKNNAEFAMQGSGPSIKTIIVDKNIAENIRKIEKIDKDKRKVSISVAPITIPNKLCRSKMVDKNIITQDLEKLENFEKEQKNDFEQHTENIEPFEFFDINTQQLKQEIVSLNKYFNKSVTHIQPKKKVCDVECQTNFIFNSNVPFNSFICNRFVIDGVSSAETQTDCKPQCYILVQQPKPPCQEKLVGTDGVFQIGYQGFGSIKTDEECMDLTGVNKNIFKFLLDSASRNSEKDKIDENDKLSIFLMIFRTGLCYTNLAIFLNVNRITISKTFNYFLDYFSERLPNLVFWQNNGVLLASRPDRFQEAFGDCKVMITCTEIKVEVLPGIDTRIYCYVLFKKTENSEERLPCGFVCLKTRLDGGNPSESQIAVEVALSDVLESNDALLTSFPKIIVKLKDDGKKAFTLIPPFLKKKYERTKEEYLNVPGVRFHMGKIMHRMRVFKILSEIPNHLINRADDIIMICCVLVNLEPYLPAKALSTEVLHR